MYLLRGGRPVAVEEAREAVRRQWAAQAAYYRGPELRFAAETERSELLRKVEQAEAKLR